MDAKNTNASGEAGVNVAGRQAEATLKNVQLDYLPSTCLVQANIDGQRQASKIISDLRSYFADPDALYLALKSNLPDMLPAESLATLRGFARVIQKHLEAEAA